MVLVPARISPRSTTRCGCCFRWPSHFSADGASCWPRRKAASRTSRNGQNSRRYESGHIFTRMPILWQNGRCHCADDLSVAESGMNVCFETGLCARQRQPPASAGYCNHLRFLLAATSRASSAFIIALTNWPRFTSQRALNTASGSRCWGKIVRKWPW